MSVDSLKPLPETARNVSTSVVSHLERLIRSGELAPGERLPPERELATLLAVSRNSLREALRELESRRLIDRRQGSGTRVVDRPEAHESLIDLSAAMGAGDLRDSTELREIIEPHAAGMAAMRATTASLQQLRDSLAIKAEDLEPEASLEHSLNFHSVIAQASQNRLIAALHALTMEWTSDVQIDTHSSRESRRRSDAEHAVIFAAINEGNSEGAERAMRDHLRSVRTMIESANVSTR